MEYNIGEFIRIINGRIHGYNSQIDECNLFFSPFVAPPIEVDIDLCDATFSKYKNHSRDIKREIKDLVNKQEIKNIICSYIEKNVIPHIDEDNREWLYRDLYNSICNAENVGEASKEKFKKLYDSKSDAFLGEAFVYAIKLKNLVTKSQTNNLKYTPEVGQYNVNSNMSTTAITGGLVDSNNDLTDEYLRRSGKYTSVYRSSSIEDYFNLCVEVRETEELNRHNSVYSYLNYLSFTGKPADLEVCRLTYSDSTGTVILDKNDQSYWGRRYILFNIKMPFFDRGNTPSCPGKIHIQPKIETEELELVDDRDNVVISKRIYRIEREEIGENIIARLINESDDLKIVIKFTAPKNKSIIGTSIINFSISSGVGSDAYSSLLFYRTIVRIHSGQELCFIKNINGVRKTFLNIGKFSSEADKYEDYKNMESIFEKICFVERKFDVHFDVTDFNKEEISNILMIYNLLRNGTVDLGVQEHVIECEYEEGSDIFSGREGQLLVFGSCLSDMDIFKTKIKFADNHRIVIYTKKVDKVDQNHVSMTSVKSILYDSNNSNVDEDKLFDGVIGSRKT